MTWGLEIVAYVNVVLVAEPRCCAILPPREALGTIFPASQTTLAGSGEAIRKNSFPISGYYLIHSWSHE